MCYTHQYFANIFYSQKTIDKINEYIIDNNATVRSTAKVYGISKSTVHQDVTVRLAKVDPHLAKSVKAVLQKNKDERHIRGGLATKLKYQSSLK